MKKHIIVAPLFFVALSLTGCNLFASKDWEEKYGTPELFLSVVEEKGRHYNTIHKYNETEEDYDYGYEVRDALLSAAPFEKVSKKKKVSEKYFTYYHLISPANSGPNYCQMSIYDDGYIKIDHKSSLGPHQYLYFTMDEQKASEIVDFTFTKIENNRKIREEDAEAAQEYAKIENFIDTMRKKSSPTRCQYTELNNHVYEDTKFYDDGDLSLLMKDVEYTKTSDFTTSYPALTYNCRDKAEALEYWEYELDSKCNLVSVYYAYRNSLDEFSGLSIQYSIDANQGTAILAKAKELSGK